MKDIDDTISGIEGQTTPGDLLTLEKLNKMGTISMENQGVIGRQNALTVRVDKAWSQKFISNISSNKKVAWFISIKGDKMASRWLDVIPTCPSFTFSNPNYRILLNARFLLEQPTIPRGGIRCNCKVSGRNPWIEANGIHFTSCHKNGNGIDLHNAVLFTVTLLIRAAGLKCITEPHCCFMNVDTLRFTNQQRNSRPDALVFGIRTIALDVSIAIPYDNSEGGVIPLSQALRRMRAGGRRYSDKLDKYDLISTASGFSFQPIIFETTGAMHIKSYEYLETVLKNFNSHYRKGVLLKKYWMDRVSCSFQQQFANQINNKISLLRGTAISDTHYENRTDFINEMGSL